jgi:GTP-binding protein LepA
MTEKPEVTCGDVGYIITGIKNAKEVKVGDTITLTNNPTPELIKGFEEVKPMVFAGIFPVNTDDFEELRECMDKLQLNDASLTYELETSQALGFRISLWLPGIAPYGDHPGKAGSVNLIKQ